MNLYEQTKYTMQPNYLISTFIREYDISKANINILLKYGVLSKDEYDLYNNMDKKLRQIIIGDKVLKNRPDVVEILQKGITEAKREFFEANDIQECDVLSIKNDAIFIIEKIPTITNVGGIEFVNNNVYTSYYRLGNNTEFFYYYNVVTNTEVLDVKGVNKNNLMLHKDFMIEFLKVCFNSAQMDSINSTIDIVTTFYTRYIQLDVEVEYYRQLDAHSLYVLKALSTYNTYTSEILAEKNKEFVDISYNLNIIRQLHQIYSGIYFTNVK